MSARLVYKKAIDERLMKNSPDKSCHSHTHGRVNLVTTLTIPATAEVEVMANESTVSVFSEDPKS